MKKLLSVIMTLVMVISAFSALTVTASAASKWDGYIKITTADDLLKMQDSTGKFYLANDIDLADYGLWKGFDFYGTLDGNGHSIKNMLSNTYGLFKKINGAVIKNLALENVEIKTNNSNVGGIAVESGDKGATVSNCFVSGSVTSSNSYGGKVAGFIGFAKDKAPVFKNCVNAADIISNGSAAGLLAGSAHGKFTNCINYGDIKVNSEASEIRIGGIAGYLNTTMTSCYNFGDIKYYHKALGKYVSGGGLVGRADENAIFKNCATATESAVTFKASTCLAEAKTEVNIKTLKKTATYKNFNFDSIWAMNNSDDNGVIKGCPILKHVAGASATQQSKTEGKLSYFTITVSEGDVLQLGTVMSPSNAKVTWTSSKSSVAAVSSAGKVTAKAAGSAVITAKSGTSSIKIKVVVK